MSLVVGLECVERCLRHQKLVQQVLSAELLPSCSCFAAILPPPCPLWTRMQGYMKQLQWRFGSTMACHGAIGLWRRDVLGKKVLHRITLHV